MSKISKSKISLLVVAIVLGITKNAMAGDTESSSNILNQIGRYTQESERGLSQVTNVSQLKDVQPTDWAYEALQSLVERYGCIAGYPNSTFRGKQSLSRYEFAAGLNACLNQIERLVASSESVTREDLDKLQKLTEEFQAELATLGTKVDNLEGRTAFLEDHQFSTTTKLSGETTFSLGGAFGKKKAVSANLPIDGENAGGDLQDNIFLSDRVRLEFNSSFTGKDQLTLRLQALNTPELKDATGTNFGRFQWDGANNNNNVELTIAEYRFSIGDRTVFRVAAADELDLLQKYYSIANFDLKKVHSYRYQQLD